jgi:flagellum-specific ATP synthase
MSVMPQPLANLRLYRRSGEVTRVTELAIESRGPRVVLGELCAICTAAGEPMQAEVVALQGDRLTLLPYGDCKGISVGDRVEALEVQPAIMAGDALLGAVVDAFAQPIDGSSLSGCLREMPLHPLPLNPLKRGEIGEPMETGLRVVDALLPLGQGQRLGIFAGSGVGKSSLMGMFARNVDTEIAVIALIGERGREVQDFLSKCLDEKTRRRSIVVVATSDQPAVLRARAAYTATAIAEYFRDQGRQVLLMMDSVTRFAMARREIDLAAGQPPSARGYTPSVFSAIAALCERCGGVRGGGAITALCTVLVEGDDVNDPVADALRATLDGHIVLSRELANEGHFPAIDVLHSISRLEADLLPEAVRRHARELRVQLSAYRRQREMVDMGLYKPGANAPLDRALANWERITAFLRQFPHERSPQAATRASLADLVAGAAT